MELSTSREASDRVFKGLSDAKTRVDQATQEDASYPDLIDQLNAQSEPQNYFFEPYATQWTSQIAKKGSIIPLPGVIAAALDDTKTLSLSGLLPDIRSVWTSVDGRLFLWSYAQRGRFAAKEFDQAIVAVGLVVCPAMGVFTDKVRHVLVVATTVEVVLLAVVADENQTDGSGSSSFKLQRTKLSVSTDKCVVRRIITTHNGRVFFGGSDGALYEFLYAPEQKAAADRNSLLGVALTNVPGVGTSDGCRKIAHTTSYAQYLPRFLAGLTSAPGKVIDMCVDHTRHILYMLHDDAQVSVFDLGVHGDECKAVCAVNLLADGAKYARENRRTRVSCPDERLFQPEVGTANPLKIVALSTVAPDESKVVTLVAVTSNGIRFYLTAYSRLYAYSGSGNHGKAMRPSRLEILHIRLPPPAIAVRDAPPYHAKEGMQPGYAPGKSPSAVHVAFYRKGVFLCIEGRRDQQDQLVGIAHDPISTTALSISTGLAARKPTIREAISLDTCIGKVVDIQELDPYSSEGPDKAWTAQMEAAATSNSSSKGPSSGSKRSFDEMSTGISAGRASENAPVVGEMALMYSQPSRHFLCLTNAGIQVFKKIRPLDQLHRVLLLSRGHELKAALVPFVRCFGEIQVVCMLIALACGVPTDPLVSETSTAASLIAPRRGGMKTMKSDEYIYMAAVQCIFEIAQGPPDNVPIEPAGTSSANGSSGSAGSTRIVLTTEFGMSYQHDGLVAFACRVLRPLWTTKTVGRRVVTRVSANSVNGVKPSDKAPGCVTSFENIHSPEKLDEIREIMFQLRQLMETAGPFAVSISAGAALENNPTLDGVLGEAAEAGLSRVAELVMRHQQSLSEDQLKREARFKAEQRSLYYLYQLVLRSIEAISLLRVAQEYKVSLEEPLASLSFSDFVTTTDSFLAAKTMTKALMRGRNENNQFLIKQLREQCPTFFSVSDLWHYQGYRSLSNAKLSGSPAARDNLLKESLDQFLNSCHMWDTEDCLDVLQCICEDYMLLNYYEGVVKLSLACAKHFHDAAASDLSGVKHTWKRRCYGCILLALHRLLGGEKNGSARAVANGASPQGVEEMMTLDDDTRNKHVEELFHFALASEDDSFHNLLYTWLYERGHSHLLTSIRSPYIEEFLKKKDQDLLVKLYMDQHKYLMAAKVWWGRAHEDTMDVDEYTASSALVVSHNPDIVKRQYYVSKSLSCLKSLEDVGEASEAIREVRDVLDVLQLQVRVLKALEQMMIEGETSSNSAESLRDQKMDVQLLTFKLFDASTLYNRFASKYDMWTECLYIIHVCKSEEADVIATLWRKVIFSLLPQSSNNAAFNAWRLDQREKAGLPATSSSGNGVSSFESGNWIGQMQCKILRLGKSFYFEGNDRHSDSAADTGGIVFPVGFLADLLEWISLWYIRSTGVGAFAGNVASASAIDATTFNWVLKLLLDVGVPHRELLSYYEQLYHEQPERVYREGWTLHMLQSMLAIITIWKKHAISARGGKDQLAEFATCCSNIVDLCDGVITDLRASSQDENGETWTLLEQFRRVRGELLNFRAIM